jgi:serine protease AprX
MYNSLNRESRNKAVWGPKRTWAALLLALFAFSSNAMAQSRHFRQAPSLRAGAPNFQARRGVLDRELTRRAVKPSGDSNVIITVRPGMQLPPELKSLTDKKNYFGIISGGRIKISNKLLAKYASHPSIAQIDVDRPLVTHNFRTSITTGAAAIQRAYGYTGKGIGVAVIDSGISTWHDDLTNKTRKQYPYGNQRVSAFVSFADGSQQPNDGYGHGTHVAGIIASNGYDSNGQKAGVAPDASLVVLKVLDNNGNGSISNMIAAFDWVLQNHTQYNIRVVNVSVGAGILESYTTDPLTLAAKRVVDAGVAVVVAAGNNGKDANGNKQYGGITAPGNAPWVITVGASSTNGTPDRSDDTMASFSSAGPTYKDYGAKPDLVAPGAGTISLAAPGSKLYAERASSLVKGSKATADTPYLTLSGTSMATPVVTGTVALMLQANPSLTPNMIKAILEFTAQSNPAYDTLTQGAGFLNTLGAVRLASFYAHAQPGSVMPLDPMWSKHVLWGTHMISGGVIMPGANAFGVGQSWGVSKTDSGNDNIVWGTDSGNDNVVWGTDSGSDNVVWGTSSDGNDNVVWGTDCGGNDCDNVVWGTSDANDNVVWGTADGNDNVVWGTDSGNDNIVWGTADSNDNVVWGTDSGNDNIVWGTDSGNDNIVWGTDSSNDNIVWGTDANDNVVWGTSTNGVVTWQGGSGAVTPLDWSSLRSLTDGQVFQLFKALLTNAPTSGSL